MLKIFLAHAKEDESAVINLYKRLRQRGYIPWLDKEDLLPGQNWRTEIPRAIKESQVFIACLSQRSIVKQGYVQKELRLALDVYAEKPPGSIYLIPLRLDNCLIPELSQNEYGVDFRDIQWVDLFAENGFDRLVKALEHGFPRRHVNQSAVSLPSDLSVSETRHGTSQVSFAIDNHIRMIKREQDIEARFNIAVVGKTGVGKSSLINYLFGKDIRTTGAGKPITKRGFHRENLEIDGIPTTLFDSWGLEVGNASTWIRLLQQELRLRSTKMSSQKWFHVVLYCIAASSGRVEDFELHVLEEFIKENYKVIVVLTKSDLASQEDICKIQSVVSDDLSSYIRCIAVSSESKKLRTGSTEKFGSDDLFLAIYSVFWDAISYRLPARCVDILKSLVDVWVDSQKEQVEKKINFLGSSINVVVDNLEKESVAFSAELLSSKVEDVLRREVKSVLNTYTRFTSLIDSQLQNKLSDVQKQSGIEANEYSPSVSPLSHKVAAGAVISGMSALHAASLAGSVTLSLGAVVPVLAVISPILAGSYIFTVSERKKGIKEGLDAFGDSLKEQIEKIEPDLSSKILRMLEDV